LKYFFFTLLRRICLIVFSSCVLFCVRCEFILCVK
jgi:hypothetical protein